MTTASQKQPVKPDDNNNKNQCAVESISTSSAPISLDHLVAAGPINPASPPSSSSSQIIAQGITSSVAEKLTRMEPIYPQRTTLKPVKIDVEVTGDTIDPKLADLCRIITCSLASRDHDTASARVIAHQKSVILSIRGLKKISAQIIRPKSWGLGDEFTDFIQYSVFDTTDSLGPCLRITMVNRDPNTSIKISVDSDTKKVERMNLDFPGKFTKRAERHAWEEPYYGKNKVYPSEINIPLEGSDTVPKEILSVTNAIVKEAIASALFRNGRCSAKIEKNDKPGDVSSCLLTISGMLIFSVRSLSPKRYWTKTLPEKVTSAIACYYDVSTNEHKTLIPMSIIKDYIMIDAGKRPREITTFYDNEEDQYILAEKRSKS